MNNFCLFCWTRHFDLFWDKYSAFIEYNFSRELPYKLWAIWNVLHFWTDFIVLAFLIWWLWDKEKEERSSK